MRRLLPLLALFLTLLAVGCGTTKPAVDEPVVVEIRDLDTMTVSPATNGVREEEAYEPPPPPPQTRPVYRAAAERENDLLHTKLEVSFDWENERVNGVATLRLTPIFEPQNSVVLDAKGFTFNKITLNGRALSYDYGGEQQQVTIALDRTYQKGEEYTLVIDYVATPEASGGSAAITSDKGLFFINADGAENKPQQIWTQGETEHNSRWFPTIDKPNERHTQELYVTVQDKYKTLSNGLLVSSTPQSGGMRTDYWKMDLPHAPYLFALIVGEFDVVEDERWNGIPVNYYLEDGWAEYAKDIFPYTREMLSFFSEVTGVSYPWPKYSQVVVRDYVSGAMENTTAVIFGEFMHGTKRDLVDVELNEKIVAHEMFHHWFGDYVTCESWSNLTLNEGFANYSEYLWMEEKHGKDAAESHMLSERSGYFGSVARGEPHELIWYDYDDKEDMFDAHSYNKGGAVLHMLRNYVGDEAFFATLEHYLTANQYSPVEVDELRMAFEEVTGEDLNWFFDQWFLRAGHPNLKLETEYRDGTVFLTVEQTQSTDNNVPAVFRLPTQVFVYTNDSDTPKAYDIVVDQRKQTFEMPSDVAPDVVIFDPMHTLLARYDYTKTASALATQFRVAPSYIDRYLSVQRISRKDDGAYKTQVLTNGLKDKYHGIRSLVISSLETPNTEQTVLLRKIARSDAHGATRAAAIAKLAEMNDAELKPIATEALKAYPYPVVAAGLQTLLGVDPAAAVAAAADLENVDNDDIAGAVAKLYGESGDVSKLAYFTDKMESVDGYGAVDLMSAYVKLLEQADGAKVNQGVEMMKAMAINQGTSPWRRLAATKALNDLRESKKEQADATEMVSQLKTIIDEIKDVETEPQLRQIFQQYGN